MFLESQLLPEVGIIREDSFYRQQGRWPSVGAASATTKEIRQAFADILVNQLPQVYADLASLSPKDRLAWIATMSGVILPRMQAIAVIDGDEKAGILSTVIDWSEPDTLSLDFSSIVNIVAPVEIPVQVAPTGDVELPTPIRNLPSAQDSKWRY